VQDVLFIDIVTGKSELPSGWAETFGMDCRPVKLTNQMQAGQKRSETARLLGQQLTRIVQLLENLPADQLAADAHPIDGGRNLLSCAVHAWHDEAKHQGEMFLLLKMKRALS
jgi:hypothetical protein